MLVFIECSIDEIRFLLWEKSLSSFNIKQSVKTIIYIYIYIYITYIIIEKYIFSLTYLVDSFKKYK